MMEMESVFGVIGELGPAQVYLCTALYLCYVYSGWHFLQLVFTGHEPKFSCSGGGVAHLPGNGTVTDTGGMAEELTDEEWDEALCQRYVMRTHPHHCTNLTFHDRHTSIVTDWHLICEDAFKVSLCTAMFMIGVFLGSYTTGCISDRFGRRRSLFACILIGAVFSTISSFATNYIFFALVRLVCGVFFAGVQLITFVMLTEVVGTSKRAMCGTLFESALAMSTMMMAGAAYLVMDWRNLTLIASAIGYVLLPLYLLLPESPRWLLSQGRVKEAERVLKRMARLNGRRYDNITLRSCEGRRAGGGSGSPGIWQIFRYRQLRTRTLCMMYVWLCVLGTYYGLSMVGEDLHSSIYVNEALLCLVELPGLAAAMVMMSRLGRRVTSAVGLLLAGVSCLVVFITPHVTSTAHMSHDTMLSVKTALTLFGKCSVTVAMATSFIHTSELMPTTIRNSGLGICTMMGRLGSIAAPFVAKLGYYYPLVDYAIFGCMSLTAGALCLTVPETLNRPMPDTIEEALHAKPEDKNRNYKPSDRLLTQPTYYGSIGDANTPATDSNGAKATACPA